MVSKIVWLILLLGISVNAITPVSESTLNPKASFTPLSIPYEKYSLENGLTVILSEDHTTPFVAVDVWYNVGSVNEIKNRTGFAHLFEHLMFEGTAHTKQGQHFSLLDGVGGFSINASTSFDRTNYYQTVPKNRLELALALESSRMSFLNINQRALDEQRAVVRREREQRYETTPYGLASLSLWEAIFPKNNPLRGRVIGSHKDIESASLSDVKGFYDRYYGPTNATLTLVGDFNKGDVKGLIAKYFATLPKSKIERTPKIEPVKITSEEIIRYQEPLGKFPLVRMQWISPALFEKGDAELDIISIILGGGEFGRLTRALTRDKMLASSVAVYQQSMEQTSVFTIDALLNPGVKESDVMNVIDKVLDEIKNGVLKEQEIDRARNLILTHFYFGLQELGGSSGKAETLQNYNRFAKNPDYLGADLARYKAINTDKIKDVAKAYLSKDARKILIATPQQSQLAHRN